MLAELPRGSVKPFPFVMTYDIFLPEGFPIMDQKKGISCALSCTRKSRVGEIMHKKYPYTTSWVVVSNVFIHPDPWGNDPL